MLSGSAVVRRSQIGATVGLAVVLLTDLRIVSGKGPPHPLEALDLALLRDIMPASSPKCVASALIDTGSFVASGEHSDPHPSSAWSEMSAKFGA